MDLQPITNVAPGKVEHWLESTMDDMVSMRVPDGEIEAVSNTSSSPVRPKSPNHCIRTGSASPAARASNEPGPSHRGSRGVRGRGRGKAMPSFENVFGQPKMEAKVNARPLARNLTPPDRPFAVPPHLNKTPPAQAQRVRHSGSSARTGITHRIIAPTGTAAGSPSPRQHGVYARPRIHSSGRSGSPSNPLELCVNVCMLPKDCTTWLVYQLCEQYGNIGYIRVDNDRHKAFVVFRPAPQDVSWVGTAIGGLRFPTSDVTKPTALCRSPEGTKTYPELIHLPLASVDFGVMKSENLMMIMNSLDGPTDDNASLNLDLKKKQMQLIFDIHLPATKHLPAATRRFKILLNIAQMHEMILVRGEDQCVSVIITVDHPPEVFRKAPHIRETHDDNLSEWNEYNAWYRQTDIDANPTSRDSPVQLRKTGCILDTGRWLTYRMRIGQSAASSESFKNLCQALADHNVRADLMKNVGYTHGDLSQSWAWADSLLKQQESSKADSFLADLLQMADSVHLTFAVHYQLEVCVSLGILHECNINLAFLTRLAALEPRRAVKILEKVADRKDREYNPEQIFRFHNQVSVVEKQRPGYCAKIPSATVTPTTIYFSTPVLETSNRVVRNFKQHEDRFLRVKFNDEKHRGGLFSQDDRCMDEIFTRVFRAMTYGITVGDRHYEFLAFGSSQFRDHGAYFFASTATLSAAHIRDWMGDFTEFNNVAKYISRLGLCFTTTRGIPHQVTVQRIPDVERNGHQFTDGVGKISPLLADMIANHHKFEYRPSVFQFRMAGCKGVLAVCPSLRGMTVQIRPSQDKFPAPFHGLEIAKTSKFTSANLNVQLIMVLSALGIKDRVFMEKLRIMLADMEEAMTDETMARKLLEKNIDYSQMTLALSQAIGDGFMETREPFIISWLHLWRSWSLKYLKQKARILVEQGAYVFGVTDETGTLKGHFNDGGKAFDDARNAEAEVRDSKARVSKQIPAVGKVELKKAEDETSIATNSDRSDPDGDDKSTNTDHAKLKDSDGEELEIPSLPEIFIQVPNPDAKGGYTVIEAVCIITRSPTMHPGDVRVVRAVNVLALHHLKDCVVLPQTGDHDLANMCSGGDLDGDEYIVSWDPALIPHESKWNRPAMDFTTAKPPPRSGPVTVQDMAAFFVNHIKNDKLGQIAVAHRYWADFEHDGVENEKCIQLAELHSQAVDYPKTGVPAKFPRELQLKIRPHWSESKGRTYRSRKVIGQLYDAVKLDSFRPTWELPFDQRILSACTPSQQTLEDAKEVKDLYDEAVRRIMAQYGIKNEFEVFTTFVQEHHQELGDYKFGETIDEVSTSLREQFQDQCYEKAGTTSKDRDWEKMKPFIVAMYTVTAREVEEVVADSQQVVERSGRQEPKSVLTFDQVPFMSFPWIFGRDLANIAKGRNGSSSLAYQTPKARPTLPADKKLAKAQAMAAKYGELEPLAEVHMPEGMILHDGDVMNLHHNKKNRTESCSERALEEGSSRNLKQSSPGERIAVTRSLAAPLESGVGEASRDTAERTCRANPEEVHLTIEDGISDTPHQLGNSTTILAKDALHDHGQLPARSSIEERNAAMSEATQNGFRQPVTIDLSQFEHSKIVAATHDDVGQENASLAMAVANAIGARKIELGEKSSTEIEESTVVAVVGVERAVRGSYDTTQYAGVTRECNDLSEREFLALDCQHSAATEIGDLEVLLGEEGEVEEEEVEIVFEATPSNMLEDE